MNNCKMFSRRKFLKIMALAGAGAVIDRYPLGVLAHAGKRGAFPVVVIGAGIGGLTAAAYLSQQGFAVTLIERHDRPGGYATAFERAEGKYRFEVSLHATVADNAGPQRILSELGVWDGLQRVDIPELCTIALPDGCLRLPAKNPDAFIQVLAQRFPGEEGGIKGFVADIRQVHQEMQGHIGKVLKMDQLEGLSLDQWVKQHVRHTELQSILASFWGYYGLPPSKLNALFYAIATGEYLLYGGQYYKARSQDLSDALMQAVQAQGGTVLLETEAVRIGVEKGRVAWVMDDRGRQHVARAIIANANIPEVINQLVDGPAMPEDYKRTMAAFSPSLSSCIVWLGIKGDLRQQIKGYEVFLPEAGDGDQAYRCALEGDFSRVGLSVTLYDHLFEGYSQPGTNTMTVMSLCGYEPWRRYADDYRAGDKTAYNRHKQLMTQTFIKRVEESLAPGLRNRIEVVEAATPLTNIRYTGNPQGAIYGFSRPGQQANPLDVRTPLTGLYMAGAWTHGAGYTPAMMAGRQAVEALVKDVKKCMDAD